MSIEAYSLLKNGNLKLSEHFKVREFRCRDGSDPVFIDTELVEILEKIRTHFNKPVTITSAFRTASWNAKQKNAAKYSQHLYGKAADIQVQGISVEQVYAYADKLLAGRGGVGIYPPGLGRANGWVHVDVRKKRAGEGVMPMETILSAIIAGAVTLIGVLIANSKSNAVMEYKIEELTREVRKHNGFAEKIPVIQRDIQVLNHRVSDIETYEHERS